VAVITVDTRCMFTSWQNYELRYMYDNNLTYSRMHNQASSLY